ncbi:carboxylating nicotinate-nucleotide diphosphorylase [Cytobacillus sp. IB215665]|uniref:carboxylating nicotinate-nucleotide diphosphorylase n=1 Tax=Cytobacillus sp. IB215665 TaxID=3097357 RepID=UPI002A0B4570|nr:carboxylating nicotinate-nucleotide diphosphorylase [Cytobacillus sp. IB215665]MDX8364070.1 carboxylating nicotinate-nucleotide diphosphorylase [Cytobacillus sp. IB215665]
MNKIKLRKDIEQFFLEDVGERDVTSETIFPTHQQGIAKMIAKGDGLFCGEDIIKEGYLILDSNITVETHKADGEIVAAGDVIATIEGSIQNILIGERVILNLIQRMSGIATLTNEVVKRLNSDHTRICDTRKTTPGLRMFEKYAVSCGGGYNHRIGLYDGVMIKDNHIAFCGSITKAVAAVRQQVGHMVKIEVETETEEQVLEAVQAKADVIMFDNCTPEAITKYVSLVPTSIITEASGGINLESLPLYRDTGVDYISLGMLTHSVKALDISMRVK